MHILVVGANLCNRGAESMLLTLISRIQTAIPNARFTVWSYARDDKEKAGTVVHSEPNGIDATFELSYNHKTAGLLLLQGMLCVAPLRPLALLARKFSSFVSDVEQADAVVDLSGFALTRNRPWWRHVIYLLEARTAHACSTPFLAMTQSFGPFRSSLEILIAKWALRNAAFISARGPMSARHLESLGLIRDRDFVVAPDITYHFEPAAPVRVPNHLGRAQRPKIAVIPNTNVYNRASDSPKRNDPDNAYVRALAMLCRCAIDRYGCQLVFIPHESYSSRFDDLSIIELICSDSSIARHATVLDVASPASVIKSVVLGCDAIISSRYHGMVAALSSGVPAFVLGWADKYRESAEMAGTTESAFNFSELEADSIVSLFTRFWEARESTRRALLERLPQNQQDSMHAIETMIGFIQSRGSE